MEHRTNNAFKEITGASAAWAVIMIVLGLLAVFIPLAAGIGMAVLVSWIIVWGGFTYVAFAFSGRDAGAFAWRLLIGIVYVAGGGYLLFHPQIALESLTLAMAVLFLLEGVLEIVLFSRFRADSGSGWILFDAVVTLLLAYVIWRPWPSSSTWAIGTILGINLILSGFTWLMCSIAARKALGELNG
ncbi:MAG: DUF308 domain-containing protein [Terracidiphilus sp.]|jgi:uncharacterized membrane protein HdeD (DUF308 family)